MTWFPTFTNWPAGAIAAGIVIPALLILYFLKLRRKEVAVASTLLWRKAIRDLQVNAPFQKLRRNLLLLLQLIVLLFLILALTRPVTNYVAPPGKTTIFLIDRSASMSVKDQAGHSRLEEAKIRAMELVDAMPHDGRAMVIAFDDRPETMQSFTADPKQLKAAIDKIEQTQRRSDINSAYQLASSQHDNFNPEVNGAGKEQKPDVRVFSDGRMLNPEEANVRLNVTPHTIGSDQTANVAVVELNASRNYERPNEVQVLAQLKNFGPQPVSVPVRVSVDNEPITIQNARADEVFLLPERWDETTRRNWETANNKRHSSVIPFNLSLPRQAIVRVEQLNKTNDALPLDDFAQIIVPAPKSLKALLVTDGGNQFLPASAKAQAQYVKATDILSPAAYEDQKPSSYDVVVFDGYKPLFLPEQGNFIWFGACPDGIGTKVETDAPPGKPGGDPIMLKDLRVLDWQREHPILKDLAMRRLFVSRAIKLTAPADQQVLVEGREIGEKGARAPLMVLDHGPKRTHLIVAFDPVLTNWPFYPGFPKFLHQAYKFLSVGELAESRQAIRPGDTVRISRTLLEQAAPGLKKISLNGPDGKRDIAIPDTGDFVLPAMEKVGLYSTEPAIPGYEQIAVNILDPNESNVMPGTIPGVDPNAADEGAGGPGKRRLELWWWLAAGALGMLLVEWWVYTRRVHL
jgi:hypothetical protein